MSLDNPSTQIVVLGAGVIGLTVAHVLSSDTRYKVRIVARDMPEDLDSQAFASPWAGANWSPMGTPNERVYKWEKTTYDKFWSLIQSGLAISSQSKVFYDANTDLQSLWYRDLVRKFRVLESGDLPAGQKAGVGFQTVSVCPQHYLPWLTQELRARGVEFVRRRVASLGEAAALVSPNGVLINATGLGARSLIGLEDKDVYPIRGQTIVIDNPKVNECMSIEQAFIHNTGGDVTYIIPRPSPNAPSGSGFTTILGGKYQHGNWDTSFSADDARGILARCTALVPAIGDKETRVLKHNVALRPARVGGPRVEAEWVDVPKATEWLTDEETAVTVKGQVLVVHAYGFGSAGYQMSWGAAQEVGELVNSHIEPNKKAS